MSEQAPTPTPSAAPRLPGGPSTLVLAGTVVVAAAAALWVFGGGGGGDAQDERTASEAAPTLDWRAQWKVAAFEGARATPPDGDAAVIGAVNLARLEDVEATLGELRKAGPLRALDPRGKRRYDLYSAGALLSAARSGKAEPIHPLEAAWLARALCDGVAKDCAIALVQGPVPTPLMLSRGRYVVMSGERVIDPFAADGAATAAATAAATPPTRLGDAEAVASFLVLRAHVARASGRYNEAHADLAAAERMAPELPAAAFARGVLQIEQGLVDRGVETCVAALARADDPMARLFLADIFSATERFFKAFEMVEAVATRFPSLAEGHVAQGMLRAGRVGTSPEAKRAELIASARASFEKALALDSTVAGAVAGLAQLDILGGDEAAALERLQAALKVRSDLETGSMLVQLLLSRERTTDAIAVLEAIDRKDDERWWLLDVQARAMSGDTDRALTDAEEAGRRFPASQQVAVLRAQLLRHANRIDEAAAVVAKLAAAEGDDAARYGAMAGELLLQAGRVDEAIAALERSLAADSRQKDASLLLIAALGQAGRGTERDALAAKVVERGAATHEEIATVLLEIGDAEGAEALLRAAVATLDVGAEAGRRAATILVMLQVASGRRAAADATRLALVAKAGGVESEGGKALDEALAGAIAGAEAELEKMAAEGQPPGPADAPPPPPPESQP